MRKDDHLYIDVHTLKKRGWTDALIQNFLGQADRMKSVEHFSNFTGKRTYFLGRVEEEEATLDFREAFSASLRRRNISREQIEEFLRFREETSNAVEEWRASLTEEEILRMKVAHDLAAIFEEIGSQGYLIPRNLH